MAEKSNATPRLLAYFWYRQCADEVQCQEVGRMDNPNEVFFAYLRLEFHEVIQRGFEDGRRSPQKFDDSPARAWRRYPGPKHMAVWSYLAHMPEGSTLDDALSLTRTGTKGYRSLDAVSSQIGRYIAGEESLAEDVMETLCTGLRATPEQRNFMMGLTARSAEGFASEKRCHEIYERLAAGKCEADGLLVETENAPRQISITPRQPEDADADRSSPKTSKRVGSPSAKSRRSRFARLKSRLGPRERVFVLLVAIFVMAGIVVVPAVLDDATRDGDERPYDPGFGNRALIVLPPWSADQLTVGGLTVDDVRQGAVTSTADDVSNLHIALEQNAEQQRLPIRFAFHTPSLSGPTTDGSPPADLAVSMSVAQHLPGDQNGAFTVFDSPYLYEGPRTILPGGQTQPVRPVWSLYPQLAWTSGSTSVGGLAYSNIGVDYALGRAEGDTVVLGATELYIQSGFGFPCGVTELQITATMYMGPDRRASMNPDGDPAFEDRVAWVFVHNTCGNA